MNGNHEIWRHSRDSHVEHEREYLRRLYTRMPENPDIPPYYYNEVKPAPIHHVFKPNKYINVAVTMSVAPATLFTLGVSPALGLIEAAAGLTWCGLMYNREVNYEPGEEKSRIANFLLYDLRGELADGRDWIKGKVTKFLSNRRV